MQGMQYTDMPTLQPEFGYNNYSPEYLALQKSRQAQQQAKQKRTAQANQQGQQQTANRQANQQAWDSNPSLPGYNSNGQWTGFDHNGQPLSGGMPQSPMGQSGGSPQIPMEQYPVAGGSSLPGGSQSPIINVNQSPPLPPVYSPQDTREAQNRAFAAAGRFTMPNILSGMGRQGLSRRGMGGAALPAYANAQAQGALTAALLPLQHSQANFNQGLAGDQYRFNEALGLAGASLASQQAINNYGLGNLGSLAQLLSTLSSSWR